jgi:hypothetical protein
MLTLLEVRGRALNRGAAFAGKPRSYRRFVVYTNPM